MVNWLSEHIEARRPFVFGELLIEPGPAGWIVRGPGAKAGGHSLGGSLDELRRWVRVDAAGRYRPLTGARDLPPGWSVEMPTDDTLIAALETIYPLATRHIAQLATGALRLVPLATVLARQSGRYAASSGLSSPGRAAAVQVVCGNCVRTPAWDESPALPGDGAIPCPEPCGVLVSFCREAALWEQDRPPPTPSDPAVAFADFESPGNRLREAWLSQRLATTPGGMR